LIENNWMIGGTGCYLVDWAAPQIVNNVIVAKGRAITFDSIDWRGEWKGNQIYSLDESPFATQGGLPVQPYSWVEWQKGTGETGKFTLGLPTAPQWAILGNAVALWNPTSQTQPLPVAVGRQAFDPITGQLISQCGAGKLCVGIFR